MWLLCSNAMLEYPRGQAQVRMRACLGKRRPHPPLLWSLPKAQQRPSIHFECGFLVQAVHGELQMPGVLATDAVAVQFEHQAVPLINSAQGSGSGSQLARGRADRIRVSDGA